MATPPEPAGREFFEKLQDVELKGWLMFCSLDGNALFDNPSLCIEFMCSVEHASREELIARCVSYNILV